MRVTISFFLLLVVLACGAATAQVSPSGLIADWRMDGDGVLLPDHSGTGNHAVISGEAVLTLDKDMGPVLYVFGASGGATVPHHASLEPAVGTIQAWVNLDRLTNADIISKSTLRLMRSGRDAGVSVYGLRVDRTGAPTGFIANDDGRDIWTFLTVHAHRLVPGAWYLLTMRWDGERFSIFVNGDFMRAGRYDPIPEIGLSYYEGSPFYIAYPTRWSGASEDHFEGKIGRVRVYDRALSDEEIEAGYQAEAPAARFNWPH